MPTSTRNVLGGLIAGLAALTAAGCGGAASGTTGAASGQSSTAGKHVTLAVFPYAFANPYASANIAAIKAQAARMGASIKMFDSGFDAGKQLNEVEDAIASGKYAGMIISPDDGNAIAPGIQDAGAHGIKVVCIGSPCGPDAASVQPQVKGELAYVGVSAAKDGAIQAKLFAEACKGKNPCKVAYILGLASNSSETARTNALKQALKRYPNVKLVGTVEGKFDRQASYQAAQNLLQAHTDLAAIGSGSDQMTLGAEQAAKEAHRHIALIGNAASAEGVAAVRAGRWFGTSVWLPQTEAKIGTQIVIDALRGKKVPSSVDVRTKSPIGPAVTRRNATRFNAQWHSS